MTSSDAGRSRGYLRAFRIRSYRYQWGADLLTSWAFEMELLILGWFVLVATDSALVLSALGALHFGGTLLSPWFGVIADRVDRRTMLLVLRCTYGALAAAVMALGLTGIVQPWHIFAIAAVSGLIRPSDLVVRNSLIADTVPAQELRNAMGLSRTTVDSARIVGSLLGAGLLSTIGIGPAYGAVCGFYIASVFLAFGITVRRTLPPSVVKPWAELKLGISYMRRNDTIVAIMSLAFLVNLTAFPISHGLLPVVARDVFGMDENGLARLVAVYAVGALIGSVCTATVFRAQRPGRTMVLHTLGWYVMLIIFGHIEDPLAGMLLMMIIGTLQSFAMVSMSVLLLTTAEPAYRGRVSGVRMLAVYGLPMGLIAGGALIEWTSITTTFVGYGVFGIVCTVGIVARWPHVMR